MKMNKLDIAFDTIEINCVESLRRLVQGDFSAWYGLSTDCSRARVGEALGQSQDDIDLYSYLGGVSSRYRIYPGKVPHSVYVWYEDDCAVALQTHSVTPVSPIEEQLDEPDVRERSRLPGAKTQWIYASRGLTLHVDTATGAIARLSAYHPMSLAEYRISWLYRVEALRHHIE